MKVPPPIPPTTDSEMVEDSREMDNVSNEQAHAENTDNGEGVSEKPSSSDDNNVPGMYTLFIHDNMNIFMLILRYQVVRLLDKSHEFCVHCS